MKAQKYADLMAEMEGSIEGSVGNKNYHSGELVTDLVPESIPDMQEGVNIQDSNYEDEMYSEEQLKRHSEANMNPFTVDGIPSRWYHNKLRSTWHFDPKGDPNEKTYNILCKFEGDWDKGIKRALKRSKEHTIGNYRQRNQSLQDKSLHDGEMMDIKRGSGRDDVSCMYYDTPVALQYNTDGEEKWKIDRHEAYEPFFKMLESIGMYDIHLMRVHIQRLGQVTPAHIDQQMRYARPHWRKRWTDAGADKEPLKLRRVLIALTDWDYGHVWQMGNTYYQGYDAGECMVYDWCNMPHGTANFGYTPRITLQATGFMDDTIFPELLANGSKDNIIKV
jgi:hypothetical protein